MPIKDYGFTEIQGDFSGIPARITACHKNKFEIVCDNGVALAHLKTSQYAFGDEQYPTTGDFVLVDWQEHGESVIQKTLPRRTCFRRIDPSTNGKGSQVVAMNSSV